MFSLFRKRAKPPEEPPLRPEEIDGLMAGPVKDWPAVIVIGDEAVAGFTPAQPPRDRAPEP